MVFIFSVETFAVSASLWRAAYVVQQCSVYLLRKTPRDFKKTDQNYLR